MRLEGGHRPCKLPSFETPAKGALPGDEGPSVQVRAYSFTAPVIADT
jgi:hypothetical protein